MIWLPAGIALVAILLFGYRRPGVFIGVILANLPLDLPLWIILGMATGATLSALAALFSCSGTAASILPSTGSAMSWHSYSLGRAAVRRAVPPPASRSCLSAGDPLG